MKNESKISMKKVFDSFDLDKSGFIDGKELFEVCRQLEVEVTQQEVDDLM